ncbi:MAG: C40 family peptidase [Desulfobacteraceae bacterium]|nr:C40 family peptidase [Desulfobacteraceae bacterium]
MEPAKTPAAAHRKASRAHKKTKGQPKPMVNSSTKAKTESITSEISEELPANLEEEIKKFSGLRYRYGSGGRDGIDCSALVKKVYADVFGIDLPRSSSAQSQDKIAQLVSDNDLQTGDLLFFGPRRKQVNHVGIYLAGGYFLHAARSEGVTISRLDDQYWKSRWILSKRVRGLQIDNDADVMKDLDSNLESLSLGLAFNDDSAAQSIHFIDTGLQFGAASELRLSALYKESLDQAPLGLIDQSTLSLRDPFYPSESESRLRLSAVFSPLPLQGFKLIPSITQILDRTDKTGALSETQMLGLETWMVMPSSRMALFLGAHAMNQDDLLQRPLKMAPDWQTLDFSLGVHYRFSQSLGFSLLGTHSYTSAFGENDGQSKSSHVLDDITFNLNYKF